MLSHVLFPESIHLLPPPHGRSSSQPTVCPPFLISSPSLPKKKTFAQALNNACDIPLSQLHVPCLKGKELAIAIPEDEYLAGLEASKTSLHGRILLSKGDRPVKIEDLHIKLSQLWRPLASWKVIPIGKGYFEFSFSSLEDMRKVLSVGSWNLEPGTLRLFTWTPDFNPELVRQTNVQCWIRIFGLPHEYWRPKILFAIATGVGIPLSLDDATINRSLGHYARILVDLDLAGNIRDKILVERKDFAFFVRIEYERLPEFCSSCKMIGHSLGNCRKYVTKRHGADQAAASNDAINNGKATRKFMLLRVSLLQFRFLRGIMVLTMPIRIRERRCWIAMIRFRVVFMLIRFLRRCLKIKQESLGTLMSFQLRMNLVIEVCFLA